MNKRRVTGNERIVRTEAKDEMTATDEGVESLSNP